MEKERNLNNLRYSNNQFLQQAIRVNHAGEYGAICIYSGQKFILKKSSIINEITEMEEQEKSIFTILMRKSRSKKFVLLFCCQFGVF